MNKGIPIGNNRQQQIKVNLDDCPSLFCPNCRKLHKDQGNFRPLVRFKVVPATLSPSGREMLVPIIQYFCSKCGGQLKDENQIPVITIQR